jgi:monovalent cation:H+ antiporter-2, CPA2 family
MGLGLAMLMQWKVSEGLVFGLALSVASTVVLLRALQERRLMETGRGRIAVGWLIVEDLAMVLALVLIPTFANLQTGNVTTAASLLGARFELGLWGILLLTAVKIALFIALMLVVGRRLIPWILHYIAHTGSRELFRLAVLAIALGVAFGSTKLFDVSLALGAFFAGMMLRESPLSARAAQESLPLRDAFAVLFFVSVGMLFDPFSVIRDPWPLIATLLVIIVGKSIAAFLIVVAFRHPVATALTISASLAQIGEFSFILAELGYGSKLLSKQARDLILAGAILSIMLNPLVFAGVDWLIAWLERRKAPSPSLVVPAKAIPVTHLRDHTILVGYGRVGNIIGNDLKQKKLPFLVIEASDSTVTKLKESGVEALMGNAAQPEILKAAALPASRNVVVAIPEAFEAGQIVQQARAASARVRIVARAHSDAEVEHLKGLGADMVIMGEREIARGMIEELERSFSEAADEHSSRTAEAGARG